ncbi:RCC1 domain-containing protein [Paenibacillus durus]|uniref:RCC1 repeat-containing protein n=1 Tax=Paenibacillus durus ATCC 35681 TaxID=1333534 RepID=A0A0F7CHL1_PAEDU|nr:hypothetical protein [Paenibacillus durus]AKG34576.1 hypothetical protein VK70_08290 [Paenibacillus durus ATCC 35681]
MFIKRQMKHLSGLLLASAVIFAALPTSAKATQSPAYSLAKLPGIKEIAAKPGFWGGSAFALGKDGTVWSWGSNYSGQFANGTAGPVNWSNAPHRVAGLEGTKKLALGGNYYMALSLDGNVKVWGAFLRTGGWSAAAADGNQWAIPLPETIDGLTGITDIAAGENSALALRKDGNVIAWLAPTASSTGGISSDDAASSQEASHDEAAMLPAASMVPGLTGVKAVYGDGGNLFSTVKKDGRESWRKAWVLRLNGTAEAMKFPLLIPAHSNITPLRTEGLGLAGQAAMRCL